MRILFVSCMLVLTACAHGKAFDLIKIECPNGKVVEIKISASNNPNLRQAALNNRARVACGISEKK